MAIGSGSGPSTCGERHGSFHRAGSLFVSAPNEPTGGPLKGVDGIQGNHPLTVQRDVQRDL